MRIKLATTVGHFVHGLDFENLHMAGTCLCLFAPTDCTEGYERGNITDPGLYLIHPLMAPDPFLVYCKMLAQYMRTYIMIRKNGNLDFDRPFADYQAGFGDLGLKGQWLGLEKVDSHVELGI